MSNESLRIDLEGGGLLRFYPEIGDEPRKIAHDASPESRLLGPEITTANSAMCLRGREKEAVSR